jgi:hypothetical protein
VTDNLTGLIWLKNANCFGPSNLSEIYDSIKQLSSGRCGLSDGSTIGEWRLPNVNEVESMFDLGTAGPSLPAGHPFINLTTSSIASSTGRVGQTWAIGTNFGLYVHESNAVSGYIGWPVRVRNSFTITTAVGNGGSISPVSPSVNYGSSQTFTITPDTNYHVADVNVDGVSVGTVTTYTFNDVTAAHTISATFAIDTHKSLPWLLLLLGD